MDMHLTSSFLLNLAAQSCTHITNITLDCVQLQHLVLAQCQSLVHLSLSTPALSFLDCTGCKELTAVRARGESLSPALVTVNIFGCRKLLTAHIETLLNLCGGTVTHLNANGCPEFGPLVISLPRLCPKLQSLDAKGCKAPKSARNHFSSGIHIEM